ncbi:Kelch repeat-containing protein [Rhodothermus marinus]|uniref:Kelch repeat-containing protein n=1 Tax=Rhodothermus marinus TaxID=29549 RepID=UPI001FB2793B|nr:kelch repeat-containing protein [Rhodothermus marinus]
MAADLITFELRDDSLVLLTPGLGLYITPLAAHVMAPLDAAGTRFLVAGALATPDYVETQTFRLVLEPAGRVDTLLVPAPPEPRQFAAAVPLRPGIVVLLGGYAGQLSRTYPYPLLYVEEANRFFRFRALLLQPRFDAAATSLEDFRILITGGFGPDGQGLAWTEVVAFAPF